MNKHKLLAQISLLDTNFGNLWHPHLQLGDKLLQPLM